MQEAFAAVRRERDAGQRATEGWLLAEEARRVAEARVAELELALCDSEGEARERELRARAMAESAAAKSLIESAESVERWQDRCRVCEGHAKQLSEELSRVEKREQEVVWRLEKSEKEVARLAAALGDLERDIQGEAKRRAVAIFQAEQIKGGKGGKGRERGMGIGRLGAIASKDVDCQTEASIASQVSEASRRLVASAEAMGPYPTLAVSCILHHPPSSCILHYPPSSCILSISPPISHPCSLSRSITWQWRPSPCKNLAPKGISPCNSNHVRCCSLPSS